MIVERFPRILLRTEGLAAFAAALAVYLDGSYSILALVILFLAPDVSFLGYLGGTRTGAVVYNAVHTYAGPLALGAIGLVGDADVAVQVALIWIAHIGLDRALGYGLKYPSAFDDTHLRRV